jgi:hypothetical protein
MSKKTELAVFEKTIAIPGVRVTRTAMEFGDKVDEAALREAGAFLQAVDACAAWWWGDFLAAFCGYELRAEEMENGQLDEITRADRLKQYTSHYAVMAGKEPKTLSHYLRTARGFNFSRRREELSWSHHAEALDASGGDEAVADEWLDLAVKHHWSKSEMRAAIRKAARTPEDDQDGPPAQSILPLELVNCRRYVTAKIKAVDSMDLDEVRAHLEELRPVLEYGATLLRRLDPAGKESLLPAA